MISLARKNLLGEKARFILSTGGVAFSVIMILVLVGLYRGWDEKLTQYVEKVDADVWVMQEGAADMFHSTSIFSNEIGDRLRETEGVARADLLLGRMISFEVDSEDAHLVVMGYDTETGIGGPLEIVEGEQVPGDDQIIIDEVFADTKDVGIDDTLDIQDTTFDIVGISRGGNLVSFQYAFVHIEDARKLMQMEETSNYALLTFEEGANQDETISRIEENIPDIDVLSKPDYAENNKGQVLDVFLPIIMILVVIGFVVGLTVITLTIYTATLEKSREYGVLKAIGARNRHLYRIILEQSLIAGVIGFVVGTILAYVGAQLIFSIEPSFVTSFSLVDLAGTFGAVLVMVMLASYIPIRRIVSIHPAIVFQS